MLLLSQHFTRRRWILPGRGLGCNWRGVKREVSADWSQADKESQHCDSPWLQLSQIALLVISYHWMFPGGRCVYPEPCSTPQCLCATGGGAEETIGGESDNVWQYSQHSPHSPTGSGAADPAWREIDRGREITTRSAFEGFGSMFISFEHQCT